MLLEQITGLDDFTGQPRATDGCGVPTIAVPLRNLALAMARLGARPTSPVSALTLAHGSAMRWRATRRWSPAMATQSLACWPSSANKEALKVARRA